VRRQAVEGRADASWGLALVVRRGMTAWMRVFPADEVPALPLMTATPHCLPADLCGQITVVMADMILSHQQQEISA
jgi:hypothetical protein